MDAKFTPRVRDVITFSREEALRLGHNFIGIEHILLGLIREGEGNAVKILQRLEVDLDELRRSVEGAMEPASAQRPNDKEKINLVKQAEKMLKITFLEAKLFKSPSIDTEHLLLSMLKDEDNLATRTLRKFHVDYEAVKQEVDTILADGPGDPDAFTGKGKPKAQGPQSADDDDEEGGSFSGGCRCPAQAGRQQEQDSGAGQFRPRPHQTG
ncbi:MAG: hypothetical protein IPL52_11200 [Flavobacteriales bacterium]|nr:hypothetical protein [Flavobacteriales bacterium]